MPHIYTTKALFDKIKFTLASLIKANPGIESVLDVPAGAGALSKYLLEELNLDVTAGEIDLQKWDYQGLSPVKIDVSHEKLPYNSNSFDLVVCLEGLKHFANYSFALSEFSRVLRPGGFLVVTIPNDLNLETRFRYLFNGFVDTDWAHPLSVDSPEAQNFLYPESLISFPYLFHVIRRNGLKVKTTVTSRLRPKSLILCIILFPLVYFSTTRACKGDREVKSHLLSLVWLAGRHNIIICRKGI